MPLVGFFLACCRCCGNCGGKMYQKQTSSINCRRRTLYGFTLATTLIILAGNICMFLSNEALKMSVDQSHKELSQSIGNLNTFLTAVPQQVDGVLNESYKTVEEAGRKLNNIGPELGKQIQNQFNGFLRPALRSVTTLDEETKAISTQLAQLNSSLAELQSNANRVQANLTASRSRLNETLSKPGCEGCDKLKPSLQKLQLDTSITVPGLKDLQSAVDEVVKMNLESKVTEVEDSFNSIPQRVTNETKDVIERSNQTLADINTKLSQIAKDFPLEFLTRLSNDVAVVQTDINNYMPYVQGAEYIRWCVCLAVCCVVLLVVVCNLLGLMFGPAGLKPKADPTNRSCTADCGGTFLMMGAGFSFLFSWLLMIVVLVLFLLGGNVYTLFCQPLKNGQLLQFLETPGLIPELDIGSQLGQENISVSISSVYRECEENRPLWTAFRLAELINLDDLLNVSKYTDQIQQEFDKTNISLSSITVLSPEVKQQLLDFSTGMKDFDTTSVTQQINDISSINLNTTADEIDKLATGQKDAIKSELQNEANQLRRIQFDIEINIIPELKTLNSSIKSLQSNWKKVNGTVGEVLNNVGAAQDSLNTNTTQIVKTESRKFLNCLLDYFLAFAAWAKLVITTQVGRCGPLAGTVDSVEVIVCAYTVESLNAFWFSLGWCILFFIPSIIFSMKLAKYYRRMHESDGFDDHIPMNSIPMNGFPMNGYPMNGFPRAQMK
ncbi:prominin-2 isoform X2 [Mugil cephalus]|nr:prominin-2 isoform X2 [Mugil cephalus]